jgi:hypothetical protein
MQCVVYVQIALHAKVVVAFRTSTNRQRLSDRALWTHLYRLVGLTESSTWFTPAAVPMSSNYKTKGSARSPPRTVQLTEGKGLSHP